MKTETNRSEVVKAEDGAGPIDVELIRDSTDAALDLRLDTATRAEIKAATPTLVQHLQLLLGEELGADEDEMVMDQIRKAYKVLDLNNRPTEDAAAFTSFFFMRDVADVTRRLLWIYEELSRDAT
ncbi:hypothetical protein OG824_13785 [Streptomyces prunicolor]|uniref:hypothetical protein n=1 Tax=Streptomyces prunicolor TaxID=67348 RepID=UPI002258480C|nr:hypothetical protein [Streptomyces prunicolor]MCX5236272.1 hypothetical protein [Streptomyces prunicolor]